MGSILEQLKTMTVVVADTGDLRAIEQHRPVDATTNPSLIVAAAKMPEYVEIVDEALRWADENAPGGPAQKLGAAADRLAVAFGLRILALVPGRVSTEVDARLSYDTAATVAKARHLVGLYEAAGASRERVLIKIASTWEGIRAAEVLEREGIRCNLTLLFGLHQAAACAEAGVRLISPFVGRILDWHKQKSGRASYAPEEDPGVVSVTGIYNYFKKYGYGTEVMGASFRNAGEIVELAGCDLLTIAPPLLAELSSATGELARKLDPSRAAELDLPRVPTDEASFRAAHEVDEMAREKLSEGIAGFVRAAEQLEALLAARTAELAAGRRSAAATAVFRAYDLDGDGFVTREEWSGSDAVFDAMDGDGDGRVSADELASALGAPCTLGPGRG